MKAKIAMVSLGCSKNQIDAEIMLKSLQKAGYELVSEAGLSDVTIVNTCGFIQSAKEEAIENILELATLKKEGTIKAIIVTGCLAERYKDEIMTEMDEVDAVLGIGAYDRLEEAIEKALNKEKMSAYDKKEKLSLNGERLLTTLPYYAYIKIAEGCDNCCSYCAIPSIRGRFRSRPMEEIVEEASALAKDGVRELVVIAQDTTRYGEDLYGEYKLAELLKRLSKVEDLKWIRVLYCYPDKITDELIEVIASEEKIVKYLDIPIQHCNKDVLSAMNRGMDKESITALMKKLRERVPGITLRTTLIVGFPGETKENFEELCEFVGEVKFDRLGAFTYSAEEGTKAASFDNQIDEDEKIRRAEIIMDEQGVIMERLNEEKIGKTIEVLVEGFDKFGECYFGRSEADAPDIDGKIFFTSKKKHIMGDFCQVTIDEVMDYDLIGEEKE